MEVRFCDEFQSGFGWIAQPSEFLQRASHAILAGGRVWVTDPVSGDGVEERIRSLGRPAGVVQLLDRHGRDSAATAQRLGVPLYRVPFGGIPEAPFEVIKVVDLPGWREVALWDRVQRVLVCGDALGAAPYYLAPGDRVAVSPLLRLTPPRRLARHDPLHLLLGHGEGLHGDEATAALREALATARRRMPRAVVSRVRALLPRR